MLAVNIPFESLALCKSCRDEIVNAAFSEEATSEQTRLWLSTLSLSAGRQVCRVGVDENIPVSIPQPDVVSELYQQAKVSRRLLHPPVGFSKSSSSAGALRLVLLLILGSTARNSGKLRRMGKNLKKCKTSRGRAAEHN